MTEMMQSRVHVCVHCCSCFSHTLVHEAAGWRKWQVWPGTGRSGQGWRAWWGSIPSLTTVSHPGPTTPSLGLTGASTFVPDQLLEKSKPCSRSDSSTAYSHTPLKLFCRREPGHHSPAPIQCPRYENSCFADENLQK